LTEYLYGTTDPSSIHPLDTDLRSKSTRAKLFTKMEEFWSEYGDEIVRVLDYRDPLLLKNLDMEDEKTKEIFEEYFNNNVNNPIDEGFAIDTNLFKT
jgi:hypothetical protein